jgi:hypothetical protein
MVSTVTNKPASNASAPPPAATQKTLKKFDEAKQSIGAQGSTSEHKTGSHSNHAKVEGRGERGGDSSGQGSDHHDSKQTRYVNGQKVTYTDGRITRRVDMGTDAPPATTAGKSGASVTTPLSQKPTLMSGSEAMQTARPDASRVLGQPLPQNALNSTQRPVEMRSTRSTELSAKSSGAMSTDSGGANGASNVSDARTAIQGSGNNSGSSGGGSEQGGGDQGNNAPGGNAGGTGGLGAGAGGIGGGGNIRPTATGASPEPDDVSETARTARLASLGVKLPTAANKAVGQLSKMFEININPSLKAITSEARTGQTLSPYSGNVGSQLAAASQALQNLGLPLVQAQQNGKYLDSLAWTMNVDVGELAQRLGSKIETARETVAQNGPSRPILVNTKLDPNSINSATNYFGALLSSGVSVPPSSRLLEGFEVSVPAKLMLAGSGQDVDGVTKTSLPIMKALDVTVTTQQGSVQHIHIVLPNDFEGTPLNITGVTMTTPPQAIVRLADGSEVNVDISNQAAGVLSNAEDTVPRYVDGIAARTFSEGSTKFLKRLSDLTIKGTFNPGVDVNPIKLITFGPGGMRAFEGSPSNMNTNFARGLSLEETTEPIPVGFHGAPGVRISSGGATNTHTSEGVVQQFFGVTESQAQGARELASRLNSLVDDLCNKYGLSDAARADWQDLVFGADVPSVILSVKAVQELVGKSAPDDPNAPFPMLQMELDQRLRDMVIECGLEESHFVHHTPGGPGDTVLLYTGAGEFGTEWQVAARGQKFIPTLDFLLTELKNGRGIDLKDDMEKVGASFLNIRQLTMPQMDAFVADFVRPLALLHQRGGDLDMALQASGLELSELQTMSLPDIAETLRGLGTFETLNRTLESEADQFGVKFGNLFPTYVIAADTISEGSDGNLKGSDLSMERVFRNFCENSVLAMVDTLGGQPPSLGRSAAFEQVYNEGMGRLELTKQSISINGPNGDRAPVAYFSTQAEFGATFDAALAMQAGISDENLMVNLR